MAFDRFHWIRRIGSVEREYMAARFAIDHAIEQARNDPTLLRGDLRPRELLRAAESLEGTYVIRLFAEFETALRKCWPTLKSTAAPGRVHDVMQGLASAYKIGSDQLRNAHDVREFRNSLVHEREEKTPVIGIAMARSHLGHFLGRLL